MKPQLDLHRGQLDVLLFGEKIGALAVTPDGLAAFRYTPEWLQHGYSISPFSLPLEDRVFIAERHPLDGLFGIFDDSLPDGWGRLLVDRMMRKHGIDPNEVGFLPRLALVGSSGAGALEYQPSIEMPPQQTLTNLDEIATECASVLAAREAKDLDALFAMGGSSGGARPKIFYLIDGEEWIVKFPSSADPINIGKQEYQLAIAAKSCGINLPEVRLLPSVQCDGYFATKRFDRVRKQDGSTIKIHMASAAALLETSHRIPNLDYDLLMRLTLRLTNSMHETERLFKLMVFNVLCGNRDDHSKNFTFIRQESEGWTLSPAYDLTRNQGMNGERATTVNGKGRDITDTDMLAVARKAGIPNSHAKNAIEQVKSALADSQIT